MIHGYYRTFDSVRRPYVDAVLDLPSLGVSGLELRFLVDTGADRVLLSPVAAIRLADRFRVDLKALPQATSQGVGGRANARTVEAVLTMETSSTRLEIAILEPPPRPQQPPPIPSLLGRSIISQFALFVEDRTDRVLFLDANDAAVLDLPS